MNNCLISENLKEDFNTYISYERIPNHLCNAKSKPESKIYYNAAKRMLDICMIFLTLPILIPLFVIVAIAIRIDSKGKIIYKQERIGLNGKKFFMYKFRSMVSNADNILKDLQALNEMDGPVFKIKNDPRITRVGRFLRKHSIDEFPQFINVIKGDMSLVGPRPPLVHEVLYYGSYERQRLSVKPGLTCYWQISGRNQIGFKDWIECDLKYIREQNLWLDFKMIIKTIAVVINGKGAY